MSSSVCHGNLTCICWGVRISVMWNHDYFYLCACFCCVFHRWKVLANGDSTSNNDRESLTGELCSLSLSLPIPPSPSFSLSPSPPPPPLSLFTGPRPHDWNPDVCINLKNLTCAHAYRWFATVDEALVVTLWYSVDCCLLSTRSPALVPIRPGYTTYYCFTISMILL